MKPFAIFTAALALMISALPIAAQPNSPDGLTYKSGYSSMMKLGKDIYNALKPADRALVSPQPISIETDVTPFVRLLFYPDEPRPIRGVWISAGFIDLVNNVAHAKAIDVKQRGYFARYVDILSRESGEKSLQPLPNDTNPAYWTDDMLNEQLSNFNSIVGIVVAIKLAHHYLGHYEKYRAQLEDAEGKSTPINSIISMAEWEAAFARGVRNALDAGCTIEGVIPFFEAFDKMKSRPAWAIHFLPNNVKFSKMKRELEKIQRKFFAGED